MQTNSNPRREISRNKVLISLERKAKRTKDILKDTKLSPAGWNVIRKILLEEREIEHTLIDGKEGYQLSDRGIISVNNFNNLPFSIDEIRSNDGKSYRDYSTLCGSIMSSSLPWGIISNLSIDKNIEKLQPLLPNDVIEIEELIFNKIMFNIKKRKLNKIANGKIVLGFDMDFSDLQKSFDANSLKYYDSMSKEESNLLNKYEVDPESLSQKEFKKMNDLRTKTRKKIKS
jgi:hypothetical protein